TRWSVALFACAGRAAQPGAAVRRGGVVGVGVGWASAHRSLRHWRSTVLILILISKTQIKTAYAKGVKKGGPRPTLHNQFFDGGLPSLRCFSTLSCSSSSL